MNYVHCLTVYDQMGDTHNQATVEVHVWLTKDVCVMIILGDGEMLSTRWISVHLNNEQMPVSQTS